MTDNAIFAAVALGIFGLLCIVSWHLVLTLRQTRQAALAVEQFLVSVRPRVELATERLGSVIGRTDRVLASLEDARSGAAGAFGMISQALSGWLAGAQTLSTISTAIAAIIQAWSTLTQPGRAEEAPATVGGANHE